MRRSSARDALRGRPMLLTSATSPLELGIERRSLWRPRSRGSSGRQGFRPHAISTAVFGDGAVVLTAAVWHRPVMAEAVGRSLFGGNLGAVLMCMGTISLQCVLGRGKQICLKNSALR